jgi:LmbE family N-acetylglucosaminyl deacetylase
LLQRSEAEITVRLESLRLAWSPKQLSVPIGKRLLIISPHPDDESIGCGGLLLRHRSLAEVHLLSLFRGEKGGQLPNTEWRDDPEYKAALAALRFREFCDSGLKLGATSIRQLGLPDGTLPSIADAQRLRDAVVKTNPDVVLLPWLLDAHGDHRAANVLYSWACADLQCTVLGFEVWSMLHPNAFVDISEYLADKLALVRTYESQTATIDYGPMCEARARLRAFSEPVNESRAGAVEGYMALPNRDYCDLVISLFGEKGCLRKEQL